MYIYTYMDTHTYIHHGIYISIRAIALLSE